MNDIQEQSISYAGRVDVDDLLVEQAKHDIRAFDRLYDKYVQSIYRYLFSRVGNQAVAEDLTSITFLAAIEQFPKYRHRGYFGAWLFAIARRKVAD